MTTYSRTGPTVAELAEIEANDIPALEADCRDWHRFSADFLAAYHAEQAATQGLEIIPCAWLQDRYPTASAERLAA